MPIAHGAMHVSAVVHLNEGGVQHMLPKVTADYGNHESSDLATGLAAAWLLVTAGALTLLPVADTKNLSALDSIRNPAPSSAHGSRPEPAA